MVEAKWVGTLSTTEPFNHVGLMKVRYANKESEVFEFNFAENNLPKDLTGMSANFCVVPEGKLPVERPAVIIEAAKGKVRFTMTKDCMQQYGKNTAYFNFYRGTEYLGSTQDFNYTVTWSIDGNPYDGTEYIQRLEDFLDYYAFIRETLGEDAAFSLARKVLILEDTKEDKSVVANFVAHLEDVKADKIPTNSFLNRLQLEKVDKSYFDLIIASLGTGGPRDVFYSIIALKTKYPNGEQGTFLVFDSSFPDGAHSFIWNGTTWVDLGPYQATEIADGSVSRHKIASQAVNRLKTIMYTRLPGNLIDTDNCTPGGYYSGIDGRWSLDPTLKTTEFIEVTSGQIIIRDFYTHVAFFDSSKLFVSGIVDQNIKVFTVPNNASYMTVAMNINGLHDEGVYKITDTLFYERVKKQVVTYEDKKLTVSSVNFDMRQVVKKENAIFIKQSSTVNLFNKNDDNFQSNQVLTMGGAWSATADYSTSGFIPAKSGDVFDLPGPTSWYLFSASKLHIQTIAANGTHVTVPNNSDIAYARFAIQNTVIDKAMIIKNGTMPTSYVPFVEYSLDPNIKVNVSSLVNDVSPILKKLLHLFGDSISTRDYASMPFWAVINDISDLLSISVNPRSGSRIAKREDRADSLIERYQSLPAGKDVVLVFMGTNDAANNTPIGSIDDGLETTLKGALTIIINYWETTFPKTRIGFITPIRRGNVADTKLRTYTDAIVDVLEARGVPYFDGLKEGGLNPRNGIVKAQLMPDGIHPNNDGHLYLVPRLIDFMTKL